ncbi:hypothetical protein SNEBB_002664 [Seison nebaliae]|nr:hypothetical protein SNEBB_002664 [Seison nebaliae]
MNVGHRSLDLLKFHKLLHNVVPIDEYDCTSYRSVNMGYFDENICRAVVPIIGKNMQYEMILIPINYEEKSFGFIEENKEFFFSSIFIDSGKSLLSLQDELMKDCGIENGHLKMIGINEVTPQFFQFLFVHYSNQFQNNYQYQPLLTNLPVSHKIFRSNHSTILQLMMEQYSKKFKDNLNCENVEKNFIPIQHNHSTIRLICYRQDEVNGSISFLNYMNSIPIIPVLPNRSIWLTILIFLLYKNIIKIHQVNDNTERSDMNSTYEKLLGEVVKIRGIHRIEMNPTMKHQHDGFRITLIVELVNPSENVSNDNKRRRILFDRIHLDQLPNNGELHWIRTDLKTNLTGHIEPPNVTPIVSRTSRNSFLLRRMTNDFTVNPIELKKKVTTDLFEIDADVYGNGSDSLIGSGKDTDENDEKDVESFLNLLKNSSSFQANLIFYS